MKLDILLQIYIFTVFMLNGFLIGIIFDIFRTFRKIFKTSDIITYIQDILFWIISGGITLYLIFRLNKGELRIYIFIALIIGIVIYILLFSKLFMNISVAIILTIKKIINILLYPIKMCIKFISKTIKKIKVISQKYYQKSSKSLNKVNKYIKNLQKRRKNNINIE